MRSRRDVWMILQRLKEQGLTILLTSHFMDETKVLCNEICILKKGSVVFHGTVEEATKNSQRDNFEEAYLWYTAYTGHKDIKICYARSSNWQYVFTNLYFDSNNDSMCYRIGKIFKMGISQIDKELCLWYS